MNRVERAARVRLDLLQHFLFIGEENIDAAQRFLNAAEEEIQKLAEMPGIGRLREFKQPHLVGIRSSTIKGFRDYLIFYRPIPGGIKVLRVVHGARNIDALFGETTSGDV